MLSSLVFLFSGIYQAPGRILQVYIIQNSDIDFEIVILLSFHNILQ